MPFTKEDNSIITQMSKNFYLNVAKYIPYNITPNMITVSGFLPLILVYLSWLWGYYSPTLLFMSIIINHIFDYLDGIHARATSRTSLLGSYLDHYFDLIGVLAVTHITVWTLTMSNFHAFNLMLLTVCGGYLTHYETAVSKVMYFPQYISIGELQLLGAVIHLVTAVSGISFWSLEVMGYGLGYLILPGLYLTAISYILVFLGRMPLKFSTKKIAETACLFTVLGAYIGTSLYCEDGSTLSIINMSLIGSNLIEDLISSHAFNTKLEHSWTVWPTLLIETAGYHWISFTFSFLELIYTLGLRCYELTNKTF